MNLRTKKAETFAFSIVSILFCALCFFSSCNGLAVAQEVPGKPPLTTTDPTDPFGDADPIALLKKSESTSVAPLEAASTLDLRASVYVKLQQNRYTDEAASAARRVEHKTIGLARFTASDTLDQERQWRWLFKGFASSETIRQGDGVIGSYARVDELFVDWKADSVFASVGKRRLNWGHAQGFNVVNVVAPNRDPLNPDFETEGQAMAWVNYRGMLSTDLIYTRGNYRDDTAGAGKQGGDKARWAWRWHLPSNNLDFSLLHYDGVNYQDGRPFERMTGLSLSANLAPGLTAYAELAQFSHNYRPYFNATLRPESRDKPYRKKLLGALYDFGDKSSIFAEAFYNDGGMSDADRQLWWRAVERQVASTKQFVAFGMNRRYYLLGYKKEYLEKFSTNLNLILAADHSLNARLEAAYLVTDYIDVKAIFSRSTGKAGTEFRSNPYARQFEIELSAHF